METPAQRFGLQPEPLHINFGRLSQGDTVSAEFVLTTHYEGRVDIRDVGAGCSCQETNVTKRSLEPGEHAVVFVKWNVGSRRGPIQDAIWVNHSIPPKPGEVEAKLPWQMRLRLLADVRPEILYEPQAVSFQGGVPGTATVQLAAGNPTAFNVKAVRSNSKCLGAEYNSATKQIVVRYTPQNELDYGQSIGIAVDTDVQAEPILHIPVQIKKN